MGLFKPIAQLCILAAILSGCGSDAGPLVEKGPVPWTGPGEVPVRLRVKIGGNRWTSEVFATLWDEGTGPVRATERITSLQSAIPESLLERLATTRSVPNPVRDAAGKHVAPPENGIRGMFDQPAYAAEGTVVSLSPDVMIITVRERPEGNYEYLFSDWAESTENGQQRERIVCDSGGPQLCIVAGPILPASSEMYVVATDESIASGPLEIEADQAVIPLTTGRLVLSRNGDIVEVVRE